MKKGKQSFVVEFDDILLQDGPDSEDYPSRGKLKAI